MKDLSTIMLEAIKSQTSEPVRELANQVAAGQLNLTRDQQIRTLSTIALLIDYLKDSENRFASLRTLKDEVFDILQMYRK